jgi:hypothetical protein
MEKSANEVASVFLASADDRLGDLRVHRFEKDHEAHDDEAISRLYAEFISDFERVQADLSASYGKPVRVGTKDDEDIPLNGVFRFAIWHVEGRLLYAAAAHEDRGLPVLLMLGTAKQ